jgi:hypothetical protein
MQSCMESAMCVKQERKETSKGSRLLTRPTSDFRPKKYCNALFASLAKNHFPAICTSSLFTPSTRLRACPTRRRRSIRSCRISVHSNKHRHFLISYMWSPITESKQAPGSLAWLLRARKRVNLQLAVCDGAWAAQQFLLYDRLLL